MRYVVDQPQQGARVRLGILGVISLSLFLALLTRLWFIQVIDAPQFQQAAESNRVRTVTEEAPRGRILDRNGEIIVDNRPATVVVIDREDFRRLDDDQRDEVLDRTAQLLDISVDSIERRLADPRFSPILPLPIADDVGDEALVAIRERADEFPAIRVEQQLVRDHPYGSLASHILGYVGEINEAELESRADLGYRLGDGIGKAGIERTLDQHLKGSRGTSKLEVDSQGRVLRVLDERRPVPGRDVQLTIDLRLQALAEQELKAQLDRTRGRRSSNGALAAPAGSIVVLDPTTGEVLAMASYPTYDPREFVGGITTAQWERLQDPANHFPLNNWAVQGQYAPGSTFKLITATAGLNSGLIETDTTVLDEGSFTLRNCSGRCTFRNAGGARYGYIAVQRALTVSSDVFFYNLGANFWIDRERFGNGIQQAATQYGFGVETGIELPSEQPGVVPGPELRAQRHEANPDAFPEARWFTGDNVNLSIGQGEMAVTPLQLAGAYGQFANDGVRMKPTLLSRVISPTGRTHEANEPQVAGTLEMADHDRRAILDGLAGVTTADEGTARFAFSGFDFSLLSVAGKTGTAEVRGSGDTALFVGFGPVEGARYVVAAVLEESGFGGVAAAPLVRKVFEGLAGIVEPPLPARADAIQAPGEAE